MKVFSFLFLLIFSVFSAQIAVEVPNAIMIQIHLLDGYMKTNDSKITNVLSDDVSFGHSNGWIQHFDDFKKDIQSTKVRYDDIHLESIKEMKLNKKFVSIIRIIQVKGKYKEHDFTMKLQLLEIWKKEKRKWKLWSRQSVELKP